MNKPKRNKAMRKNETIFGQLRRFCKLRLVVKEIADALKNVKDAKTA